MSVRLLVGVLLGSIVFSVPAAAQPSGNSSANWVTAGPVHAVARSGSTLFLGGDFNAIAPKTQQVGAFVTFSLGGCAMPPVNGTVYAILPDGAGGFFVGGRFERIGNTERRNLAKITGGCSVDAAWSGVVDGTVNALAFVGGILYVGGSFSQAGQQGGGMLSRSNLAAFSGSAGVLTAWNPGANGEVNALQAQESSSGSLVVIYIGGNFTSVAGQPRARLAAIDGTGDATSFVADANGPVLALHLDAVATPNRLAIGGEFTLLAGVLRNRIGILVVDATTVTVDSVFNPDANGAVRALAAFSLSPTMGRVYAGGDFTQIGGASKNYAAAISPSGVALPFDPNADGPVHTVVLDLYAGTPLLIGGRFTRLGGARRLNAGGVDPNSGAAVGWNPSFNGAVYAIATAPPFFGPFTAVGGEFDAIGARLRHNLAAINLDTGELLPFAPEVDDVVRALAVARDVLYVGGDFQHVDLQPRGRLAAFETATRSLTAWNPNADGPVHAIIVRGEITSTTVFVGGDFANIGSTPRGRVAAIDAATGAPTSWTPPAFDAVVKALESFEHLYVGGSFTNVGGAPVLHLARLDFTTGARDVTWTPSPDGDVRALCAATSTTLYAGGLFSAAGGVPRANLVELDMTTGLATAWQPEPNGAVNALECWPSLMVGGAFTTIGSGTALQTRPRLAELSASATGPTGTYATSFVTNDIGAVLDIEGHSDGVSAAAAGEPSSGDEPVARLAFFARDFAGAPGPPSLPSVAMFRSSVAGSRTVRVRWAAPIRGPRPTSYRLYAGSSPGASNYANGTSVASNQFDAVAPLGVPVYLRVQAVNAFGGGALSEELAFITSDLCSAPPDPPEFTATVNGSDVTIIWASSSGDLAPMYRLEAGLGSKRTDFVGDFPSSQTSFSVTAPAGVYFVRMRAVGYCGTSLSSSEVAVRTAGSDAPSTPPLNMAAGVDSQNSIRVSWSPPAVGVPTAYRLEAGSGFRLNDLGTVTTTATTLWFLRVPPGTYYLRVFAIGAAGSTAASDEVIFVWP